VANPRGDTIPRPIKSSFREGLEMLEYFIATPGARKGLVDTALRTADSGYLTRRLVDVAQEVIINDRDPFEGGVTPRSVWIENAVPDAPGRRSYLETRLYGRCLAEEISVTGALSRFEHQDDAYGVTSLHWDGDVKEWLEVWRPAKVSGENATITLHKASIIRDTEFALLQNDPAIERVRTLSPLTDDSELGITAASYGLSLATGKMIEPGEAVGVIAAQSIGEPGTQLTMRTFHTGGIAGSDIAGGLPRVVELFEARSPKGKATLTRSSGVIRIADDEGKGKVVIVVTDDGDEDAYTVPSAARLEVQDGSEVTAGDPIIDGPRDPKELLEIKGIRETQQYLVTEVQKVYRDQGVPIHDKHIELIVRQMTRRIAVNEPGDSDFLPGERVDGRIYTDVNRALVQDGKKPAEGRPELMGITKASLATDSWLSAASFQETTRVLTEAAIESRSDGLLGLKENIILGKLIPAGTGMEKYRHIGVEAPDYQPMEYYSMADEEQDLAEWLAGRTDLVHTVTDEDLVGVPAPSAAPAAPAAGDGADVIDLPRPDESVG
jgi:DNA-directed RNA polymerase subunit beta'